MLSQPERMVSCVQSSASTSLDFRGQELLDLKRDAAADHPERITILRAEVAVASADDVIDDGGGFAGIVGGVHRRAVTSLPHGRFGARRGRLVRSRRRV